jgi:hypothetical protein
MAVPGDDDGRNVQDGAHDGRDDPGMPITDRTIDEQAAEAFLRRNARLLDVARYDRAFHGGADEAVVRALLAYRNPDGGFAGLLEPDLRTPLSQPQSAELALRVLDEVGTVDRALADALCDWLETVTTDEGGVPFTHPSARAHPAAPHWHHADAETASLNPTAALVGLLHRHGVEHAWLDAATAFCWRRLADDAVPLEMYDVRAALWLLDDAVPAGPDPGGARRRLADGVRRHVALDPAETAPGAPGHRIGPLEVAPFPGDPGRAFVPRPAVEAALDALADRQCDDGGWDVNFTPISPAATAEWRGWATLQALLVLRAEAGSESERAPA